MFVGVGSDPTGLKDVGFGQLRQSQGVSYCMFDVDGSVLVEYDAFKDRLIM